MDTVKEGYNNWAKTYDSMLNKTRDLDQEVTQQILENYDFKQVLELGCGTGKNTQWLSKKAEYLVGFDFSQEMLLIAKSKDYPQTEVHFKTQDLTEDWHVNDESFDLITASLVLEHIPDLKHVFFQASEKLMDGGYFFISELHPFKQYLGKKAKYEKDGEWINLEVFQHHISDFTKAATKNNFQLIEMNEFFDPEEKNIPRIINFVFQNKAL